MPGECRGEVRWEGVVWNWDIKLRLGFVVVFVLVTGLGLGSVLGCDWAPLPSPCRYFCTALLLSGVAKHTWRPWKTMRRDPAGLRAGARAEVCLFFPEKSLGNHFL